MTTTVTTRNPVRSDLPTETTGGAGSPSRSRGWALAGVGASLCLAGTVVTSSMVDVIYREEFHRSTDGFADALSDKVVPMFVLHTVSTLSAVLLLVFAAGLLRRLRDAAPDSIAPMVAFSGLVGTAVVAVMGAGLNTEFMTGVMGDDRLVADSSAAMYNHWIGTIPWVWGLAGLAGLSLFAIAREGGVPRWMGRVGLVLGGLTVLVGISPFEYMAAPAAFLMLLPVSLGFLVGDRQHAAGTR